MKRKLMLSFVALLAALLAAALLGFLIGSRGKLARGAGPGFGQSFGQIFGQIFGLIVSAQEQSQLVNPARGRECTSALLQGAYAFSAEGTITAVPPGSPFPPGPYATVGVINFDGQGNLSLSNTQSYRPDHPADEHHWQLCHRQ